MSNKKPTPPPPMPMRNVRVITTDGRMIRLPPQTPEQLEAAWARMRAEKAAPKKTPKKRGKAA